MKTQAIKGLTAIGAAAGFSLSLLMIQSGDYNNSILAISAAASVSAIALIMGQWTRNKYAQN